ncbi:MAG: cupin domain-containing protein [Elusimicrobia bacterium]|nr:cupin domain-containing protein [Elusimicrobiota bacterium]
MIKVVEKPWGRELWFAQNKKYAGKILVVEKGRRLSLQYHKLKRETLYVLKGRLQLELGGRKKTLEAGSAFDVPPKTVHRFAAPSGRVTLVEVSTPEVWDVVRLSDDYGRAGKNPSKERR